jgi:hypothetical protein
MSTNLIVRFGRPINLRVRDLLARFKATPCDQCSRPVRWWSGSVWVLNVERGAHRQCWNGHLRLKAYLEFTAEQMQLSRKPHDQAKDNYSANAELRELCASARVLRESAERLQAQLQHAEELIGQTEISGFRKNGEQAYLTSISVEETPSERSRTHSARTGGS